VSRVGPEHQASDEPSKSHYRYVFGPVASRRLGRSLGIDIVPHKVCTLDCVYCEVGATTELTTLRAEYVSVDEVLDEVRERLRDEARVDYLTITGRGEPTLHSGIGEIIRRLKALEVAPVAVLTNGTLLVEREVRNELLEADLVVPSLDASNDDELRHVNRPHPSITVRGIVEGLVAFREQYRGTVWLEVLLVGGVTDNDASVHALAAFARRIRPERIQLNTVVRPPAVSGTRPVSQDELERFAGIFEPRAEVIAHTTQAANPRPGSATPEHVLDILRRRPCPLDELAGALDVSPDELHDSLRALERQGRVRTRVQDGKRYYST
jgi:wyosine [tRNA(Phe)-imidazoG37] synthetase (radical SAM superfamily)